MKKILLGTWLLLVAHVSTAQTVSDNLNWVSGTGTTTATSPDFAFCNGKKISYTVSTLNQTLFSNVSTSGDPALTDGIIVPTNTAGTFTNNIPMSISFTDTVCNLRIRFVDLDGVSNEMINNISPAYTNLVDEIGDFFDPGGMTSVDATIDNASGWVEWSGPLSSISFNYFRPGNGFGLVIDSIIFDCCEIPCNCPHKTKFNTIGSVSVNGGTSSNINLNSAGIPVKSICIDIPFYVSNVSDDCLKCNVANQERFGTFKGALSIAGTPAELHDPKGLGYSRKICWNFPTPTVVNADVQIDLIFPGVLSLSCCKNSVSYCLDVTFNNEDCTSCEFEICTKFPLATLETQTDENPKASGSTGGRYNDFAEKKGFQLSPNPSDGKVEVNILDESLVGGKLTIVHISGSTVLSTSVSKATETLQIAHFSPGTYVVTIENNGRTSSETLIFK
ncbi:hypothetical protein D3C71_930810 [compost metagenome]